jgi:hypothetical protein
MIDDTYPEATPCFETIISGELGVYMRCMHCDRRFYFGSPTVCPLCLSATTVVRSFSHGNAGYKRGCRCEVCRLGNRQHLAEWRAKR